MAFRSAATALAIAVQSAAGTPATIDTNTDLLACYDMRPGNDVFTLPNPEYTGTVHKPGDFVLGRGGSISFNVVLRGPGGTVVPAADEYVPGRLIRAAGFEEISQVAPLLAASPVGGAGTTKTAILPAAASAVDDFYNGLPMVFSDQGAGVRGVSMVRNYTGASKTADLMEEFAAAPAANVEIPAFLGYRLKADATQLFLTVYFWHDKKVYKMVNGVISQFQLNFPVSNRGDATNTYMSVTLTGDIDEADDEADENAPVVPAAGAIPPFRDGDAWLGEQSVCGSTFSFDMGIQVGYPPCPGQPNGNEPAQIVETRRSVAMTVNETTIADRDWNAIANAQTEHGLWLQYGQTAGRTVAFGVPDGRLNFSAADPSGQFVTRSPDMFIDGAEKAVSLIFPYYT